MNKNPVNAILENLSLNEARTIDLGNGAKAYQYSGKYYISKNGEKKEISSDQYYKLQDNKSMSGDGDKSSDKKSSNEQTYETSQKLINDLKYYSFDWVDLEDNYQDMIDNGDEFAKEDFEGIKSDLKKIGMDPNNAVIVDSESLSYSGGLGASSEGLDINSYLRSASSKEKVSDEEGNFATLYKFDDGTRILDVNNSAGYESGVDIYFIEKKF